MLFHFLLDPQHCCKVGEGETDDIFWVSPLRCKSANHQRFLAGFLHHTKIVIYLNLAGFWRRFLNNEVKNEKLKSVRWSKKVLNDFFTLENVLYRPIAVVVHKNEKLTFRSIFNFFCFILWWVELIRGRLTGIYYLVVLLCRGEVDDEDNTDFEDFLNFLSTVVPPEGMTVLDQEMVIRHAEFLVNQVSIILPVISVLRIRIRRDPHYERPSGFWE